MYARGWALKIHSFSHIYSESDLYAWNRPYILSKCSRWCCRRVTWVHYIRDRTRSFWYNVEWGSQQDFRVYRFVRTLCIACFCYCFYVVKSLTKRMIRVSCHKRQLYQLCLRKETGVAAAENQRLSGQRWFTLFTKLVLKNKSSGNKIIGTELNQLSQTWKAKWLSPYTSETAYSI